MVARVLILIGLSLFIFACGLDAKDCMYNKYTFSSVAHHVPCKGLGNRQLIRSVNCSDGSLWHVCCLSFRPDIQKSRQKWFRAVTKMLAIAGPECTRRILCEQSCNDGLRGVGRTDYPEVLDTEMNNTEANSYVEAFGFGESLSCFELVKSSKVALTYTDCKKRCDESFSQCAFDIRSNLLLRLIYSVSGIGHKLGMFTFNVVWWMNDGNAFLVNTVKTKFNDLLRRITKLIDSFEIYLKKFGKKSKRLADFEIEKRERNWEPFLKSYEKTDPKLVEILVSQVTYSKFLYYKNIMKEIITKY